MNKDFNVYKWRRDHLVENEIDASPEYQVAKKFTEKYSTQPNIKFSDRGQGKYRVQLYDSNSKFDFNNLESKKEAKEFFESEGYTVDINLDDRSRSWIWDFDFKKI
jgi:hypothetical protein